MFVLHVVCLIVLVNCLFVICLGVAAVLLLNVMVLFCIWICILLSSIIIVYVCLCLQKCMERVISELVYEV